MRGNGEEKREEKGKERKKEKKRRGKGKEKERKRKGKGKEKERKRRGKRRGIPEASPEYAKHPTASPESPARFTRIA